MRYVPVAETRGVTMRDHPTGHVYTLHGRDYPSATAAISHIWPYRGPPGDGKAAVTGTAAHAVMADLARGGQMPPEMIFAQDVLGPVLRLKPHLEEVGDVYAVERPMVSLSLELGGTVDLVCRRDGRLTILDWKTKAREPDEEALDKHHLQAAMYAEMWSETHGERPSQTTIVASWPDGAQAYTRDITHSLRRLYDEEGIRGVLAARRALEDSRRLET